MTNRAEVARVLAAHREELAGEHRVRSLSLFGSIARDEAGPESDVDVLVELGPRASLFTIAGLQLYLEELLGRDVDVVLRDGIKRQLRERVLGEEVPILETATDGSLAVVASEDRPNRPAPGGAVAERNWKMRIEDMLEQIEKIEQFIGSTTFETFSSDPMCINAVLYGFLIIGEAERHVPPELEACYPAVPWAKMRSMRNVLIHDYPMTNLTTVWETARDHLPPLVPMLREILEREP